MSSRKGYVVPRSKPIMVLLPVHGNKRARGAESRGLLTPTSTGTMMLATRESKRTWGHRSSQTTNTQSVYKYVRVSSPGLPETCWRRSTAFDPRGPSPTTDSSPQRRLLPRRRLQRRRPWAPPAPALPLRPPPRPLSPPSWSCAVGRGGGKRGHARSNMRGVRVRRMGVGGWGWEG